MSDNTLTYIWQPAVKGDYKSGRSGQEIKSIILHSTCGTKQGDIATLTGHTDRQVSVHWYVTKTGEIYHFVADQDSAYHAGAVTLPRYSNSASIGIEQEHLDQTDEAWPDVQIQTVARLVAALKQKHGAALEVQSHAAVAFPAGRKTDPHNYPWDKFSAYEKEAAEIAWALVQK